MHGNSNDIEQQISRVVNLLTLNSRIYWRVKPGFSNSNLDKFSWTLNDHYVFAEKFGFDVVDYAWEILNTGDPTPDRLYVEWVRS